MNIVVENDERRLKQLAGKFISSLILNSKESILLLLSGGSSLSLVDYIDIPSSCFSKMTITMLDDRFDEDSLKNNFCQLQGTAFYKTALKNGASFISTKTDNEKSVILRGEKFNRDLISWFDKNPINSVFATIGVGTDGHVGGVMPYSLNKLFFDGLFLKNGLFAIGYNASGKNEIPNRVTTTLFFMEKLIHKAVVYAVGADKSKILKNVLEAKGELNECPALILNKIKDVSLFTNNEI